MALPFLGCGGGGNNSTSGGGNPPPKVTNVYVAGTTWDSTTKNGIATYWKNDAATNLTDGTDNALTSGIAVDGSGNVYVAGWQNNGTSGNTFVTVWKNGVASNQSDGTETAIANGFALSDSGDAYVAGYTYTSLLLLCYKRWTPQKGHRQSLRSKGRARMMRRVAMEWGLCLSGRMRSSWLEAGREFGS
jgi:hypothetical protein